jgi:hypothetical protein
MAHYIGGFLEIQTRNDEDINQSFGNGYGIFGCKIFFGVEMIIFQGHKNS